MKKLLLIVSILTVSGINIYSQGKIINKEEADRLFGPVISKKEIQTEKLKMLIHRSSEVVMFKILNDELYVLDNKRNALLPIGVTVSNAEEFSIYSISIVDKLFAEGNSVSTHIEKRKDVLTMTNGNYTLEYALLCPPFCPN